MTRPPETWLPELLAKVDGFASLKENWDSYGGKPIDSKSIAHARKFIEWLVNTGVCLEPEVVPTTHGTVELEWPSLELEVEFLKDGQTMEYIVTRRTIHPLDVWFYVANAPTDPISL